jgi:MoCo/4Fe-4S cofactor protein with predicted Tat translocation signal
MRLETEENTVSNEIENSESQKSYKYWLTLDQWRQDPEFQRLAEQEFQSSPLRESDPEGGWARREFLKLMGASLAMTSFGCVRRPAQKIVPYAKKPAEIIEGLPNYYASSFVDGGEGFGVVVTTREGRPIKIDGNKCQPIHLGAMSARAHAHILGVYDPDRLTHPVRNLLNEKKTNRDSVRVSYEQADEAIAAELKKGGWAILTPSLVGSSQRKLVNEFVGSLNGKHYVWEPLSAENLSRARQEVFGDSTVPRYRFDQARLILAVDSDVLGTYLAPSEAQKGFGKGRSPSGEMNRLVVAESLLSLTGSNADERFRIRPSQAADFLCGILFQLVVRSKRSQFANDSRAIMALQAYANADEELGLPSGTLARLAEELWSARGRSVVVAGEDFKAQVAAQLLNAVLDNEGKTVDSARAPFTGYKGDSQNLSQLVADIESGKVKRLIIHGVNPVYATPKSLGFLAALQKLELSVYTGAQNDETGLYCDYILPDHHPLENWGDLEAYKGTFAIQQPTLRPLGETRAFEDTLISVAKAANVGRFSSVDSWYDYLRNQWKSQLSGNFEEAWVKLLADGYHSMDRLEGAAASGYARNSAFSLVAKQQTPRADLELVLYPTVGLRDGSLANISWLQEFPDPITKICWDNYLTVSPGLAQKRGLQEGQIVELTVGNETVSVPVHVQPGQHDEALGLAVGYGRWAAGAVANGVGVNAYNLVGFDGKRVQYRALSATIKPTSTRTRLANVAGHHSMEGRQIVVEATLAQYKENPGANIHRHKVFSAWSEHKYESYKWGMTIDLSSCTGCSACVIACQSENNIPTVGKKYVIDGREMHWMRIDRYYVGEPSDPNTVFMPLVCQHCDNAPCETVCPVAATVHSSEGTNDMIYNRCVGTRYCANNCPYKVRRFNWFNYAKMKSPLNMALNPDVTVRARGVMEKCTFCTHKIQAAKSKAKLEDRKLNDGEVKTACEASCPTGAIIFGDMNNPESRVSKSMKDQRSYTLLEELNARPAVQYQTKIRHVSSLKLDKNRKGGHGGHA